MGTRAVDQIYLMRRKKIRDSASGLFQNHELAMPGATNVKLPQDANDVANEVCLPQNIITQYKILTIFAGLVSYFCNFIVTNLFCCGQALHLSMKVFLTFAI